MNLDFSDIYNHYLNSKIYIENNRGLLISSYFIVSMFWVFFIGFVSPLLIFSTLIFGYLGGFISILSFTIASTLSYVTAKKFRKFFEKFLIKFEITHNSFFLFIIFRLIPGVPFVIKNFSAIFFKLSIKKFILATLIAETPQILLFTYIFKKLIETYEILSADFTILMITKKLLPPLFCLLLFIIAIFLLRKHFHKHYKN